MNAIKITEYDLIHQAGIDRMMEGIQAEFPVSITSPQSTRIYEVYQLSDQKFWVALQQNKVVGTIGLSLFANDKAVLKRMMVDKHFRGTTFNTATLLLEESLNWAKQKGFKEIYLGTMEQFKAAQQFYLKKALLKLTRQTSPRTMIPTRLIPCSIKLNLHKKSPSPGSSFLSIISLISLVVDLIGFKPFQIKYKQGICHFCIRLHAFNIVLLRASVFHHHL